MNNWREFKFRAWSERHKIMKDFTFSNIEDDGMLYFHEIPGLKDSKWQRIDGLIVMQYLGENCKDCNGIELCEGDIVKEINSNINWKIIFNYESLGWELFRIEEKSQIFGFLCQYVKNKIIKKIGNIYQNPELLNEG